jgi:hypothetical protein
LHASFGAKEQHSTAQVYKNLLLQQQLLRAAVEDFSDQEKLAEQAE